ncbi:PREDICTED: uncharacterized protein KIAA1683 homolog [Dipodomys ordii]|uniref:Uncharacterized protein KIAA1683 homolog n=1 Tax=Dipodomys ordii TaxID=10020 RepID=A0A1S3G6X9_DIPOR|nr:PREDICTED: uncharacterized protein KIAA1683 homolog [Dipodomys ordii]
MQQATQLPTTHQLPPTGPCFPVPQQGPGLLAELGIPPLQLQPAPSQSKAHTLPAAAPNQPEPLRVPQLRAVVESQAFKNILVDEMDLMLARAATLIQASWRGYLLRQKLVSQMSAAKAIQEAWRRFHTRRLLRSSRAALRRAPGPEADADIPYHAPQQVRFQPPGAECLACPPLMVSRETQCPSWDCLATCVPRPALSPSPAAAPGAGRACRAAFPQPATPSGLPGPCGLEPKFQSGLLTKTVRNTSLVQQTEKEVVKTKPAAARTARAPESPPCGRGARAGCRGVRVPTQTPADAEDPRPQPHPCPAPASAKAFLRPCTGLSTLRPPAQGGTAPTSRTLPQKCATSAPAPPQTCHEPATPRPPAHTHLLVSLTSMSTQTRAPSTLLRPSVPVCLLSSTKTPAQPRPAAAGTKAPASPCPGAPGRTAPQVRPVVAPSRGPAAGPSKSSSQTGPRPPPQARLAAMLTRTPAHIRNVATVLKTLCLVHPSTGTLKAPACAPQSAGAPKPKASASLKPGAGPARLPSQSCVPDAKAQAGPQPQEDLGAPKAPAKASLDVEKTKICAPRLAKPEMVSKSSMTLAMSTVASWSRVAEAKPKPAVQTQQTEIIRVRSRLLVPADTSVAPTLTKATAHTQTPTGQSRATLQPRPATAPPLPGPYPTKTARQAKALCQAQLTSCLSRPHRPAELTVVLPTTCPPPGQPQLATCFTRTAAHFCPPATQTQVLSQATRLIKVSSQLYSSTEPHRAPSSPAKLAKAPSLAHLVTCLTRVQSHTHRPVGLGGDTAGCIYTARPPSTYLGSKAQSQPLLVASKPSTLPSQDPGPPGAVSGSPSDGRAAPIPPRCLTPGPGPRPAVSEAASTLVPLLAAASCTCRGDAWGDGRESASRPRAPAGSRPEDTAAAQIAALCAELASALGSQEDLRSLLARALSQGEVRAALNQALGNTMARALPHGVLSTALTRALSWGELGVTLTRVLSRGELRTELARAVQGRLADVLGKALSDEELLALGQALCPGEPGVLQGPAGTQVTRRPTATLPKAPSKPAGSRMTVLSAPGALDCRVDPPLSWGVAVSSGRLPSCKVRARRVAVGGYTAALVRAGGDGTAWGGPPCFPTAPCGSLAAAGPPQGPLLIVPGPIPSGHPGPRGKVVSDLCLRPKPGAFCLGPDWLAGGEGPHWPQSPQSRPPPSPGWVLTANGIGPSSSRVPESGGPGPPQPPVASTVAPQAWMPVGEDSVASLRAGGVQGAHGSRAPASPPGSSCWCQSAGRGRTSPIICSCSVARCLNHLCKVTEEHVRTHSQASPRAPEGAGAPAPHPRRTPAQLQAPSAGHGKSLRKSPPSGTPAPRGPAARPRRPMSLLDELVSGLPRHPREVLAKSFKPGAARSPDSTSPSSGSSSSSARATELPTGPGPRESRAGRQEGVRPGPASPSRPPAATTGPRPPQSPRCGPLADHAASGLHRSLGRDSGRPAPAPGPPEPGRARLKRSLSLGAMVPPRDLGPDPCPPKTPAAGSGAPRAHPPPGALGGAAPPAPSQPGPAAQPAEPRKWPLGYTPPPLAAGGFLNFVQPALGCGTFPAFVQPSVECGVFPHFAQPSLSVGGPPHFSQSVGGPPHFSQPSVVAGGPPHFTQPSVVAGGPPHFAQPSVAARGPPHFTQPSVAPGGSPHFAQPFLAAGGPPHFVQPSVAPGGSPHFAQPFLAAGGPPHFAQPFLAGGLSPVLSQMSAASRASSRVIQTPSCLRAAPRLTPAFLAGFYPGLPQLSAALGALSLVQPSVVVGVGHGFREPAVPGRGGALGEAGAGPGCTPLGGRRHRDGIDPLHLRTPALRSPGFPGPPLRDATPMSPPCRERAGSRTRAMPRRHRGLQGPEPPPPPPPRSPASARRGPRPAAAPRYRRIRAGQGERRATRGAQAAGTCITFI